MDSDFGFGRVTKHVYYDPAVGEVAWHRPHDLTNNILQSVIHNEAPSAQMTSDFRQTVYARRFVVVANVKSSCAQAIKAVSQHR